MDNNLLSKFCRRQYSPPTWAKSVTNFNTKMQDFKRVMDLIASKRKIEQCNFSNWLSNAKNLVLSNGSEHVRNVIQRQ